MRRRGRRRRGKAANEVNVTPLLDVVFIMLIFFVMTASFIKEAAIDLGRFDAPLSTAAANVENKSIFISIGADDRVWINRRAITLAALRPNLEKLRADNQSARVIVMTEPHSTTGTLVHVIDIARLTGIEEVLIAGG